MADEKLTQKAGDNAQQIQAGTVIINNGINETQARELYSEMSKKAMQEYTAESHLLIEKRINDFANVFIPRLERIENGFQEFADPEFQLELRKAQVTSACTDEQADYEMLSELLLHRIENKEKRRIKASITKAIEIVDKIDDESLCGLTIAYVVEQFIPVSFSISDGIQKLSELFSKLLVSELPRNSSWASYLDILDVLRTSQMGKLINLTVFFSKKLNGYTSIGIKKDSNDYEKAKEILKSVNLSENALVQHELLEGYVRIPVVNYDGISEFSISFPSPLESRKINDKEIAALKAIWELYSHEKEKEEETNTKFKELWDSFPALKQIREWWDSIPNSFSITPIGKVLAQANAQRYVNIPTIDFDV